jgi:diacylglycerol diphosphate phosphatase/phosphatidate phosphatase
MAVSHFLLVGSCQLQTIPGTTHYLIHRGLTRLITEYFKHRVGKGRFGSIFLPFSDTAQGRLRPDFLARCKWDKVTELCAGSVFPS